MRWFVGTKAYVGIFIALLISFRLLYWWQWHIANIWSFVSVLMLFTLIVSNIIDISFKKRILSNYSRKNFYLLLFSSAIAILSTEFFLRCFFTNLNSYGEVSGAGIYGSPFYDVDLQKCDSCNGGFFFINKPNSVTELHKPEYHYKHSYNSLGLRDCEFNIQKKTGEFRILGLGDSFVEGMGTSGDSTWLKQLGHLLNQDSDGLKYETMNAGKGGSDLFFSYDLLNHCLLKYKPDLVILNLNSTDVGDIMCRGGYERYDGHGNCRPKRGGPWWDFFFGSSYILRLLVLDILHYNWQLQPGAAENIAMTAIAGKVSDYQALAKKEHFTFLLVLQPLQNELNNKSNFISKLKIDSAILKIDLTPILINKIREQHGTTTFFYYPKDGHFNSRGYGVVAKAIYDSYFKADRDDSIGMSL
jgi:lysophospholipase L1-like esterase